MPTSDDKIFVSERLPRLQDRVIVVCTSFRCRGYLDDNGIWRFDSDDKPIEGPVVAWAEFDL